MTPSSIANTIRKQLTCNSIFQSRVWSWGARGWKYGVDKKENLGFLMLTVSGMKFKGIVKISLKFNDTFMVEFIKNKRVLNKELTELWGKKKYDTIPTVMKTYEEVYCDDLNEMVDSYVELQDEYRF